MRFYQDGLEEVILFYHFKKLFSLYQNLILKEIENDHLETVKLLVEKIPDLNLCVESKEPNRMSEVNIDDEEYTRISYCGLQQPILHGICKFLLSFLLLNLCDVKFQLHGVGFMKWLEF